jgi:phage terminase large subunit-like protein
MSPGQEILHRSQGNNRLCRAANQVGKTHALCAEIHWQGLGTHPFRRIGRVMGISYCVIKDFDNGYHEFCGKLRALQPPDVLHPSCEWSLLGGYTVLDKGHRRRCIMYKDGYRVEFKGGKQDATAMESATVDAVFFDEPPKPVHWGGARARLSVTNGPTLIAMTPIGRPLGWLRKEIEGDPDTGEAPREKWEQVVIALTAANAPHRTPESIAGQIGRTSSWERGQRIEGGWDGVTPGRRFSLEERHIVDDAQRDARVYSQIRIGADYGEAAGRTAIYVIGVVGRRPPYTYVVLGEYISQERTVPAEDARGLLALLSTLGLRLEQVRSAYGDMNSAGKLGGGYSCNEAMEDSLALQMHQSRCPVTFEVPSKRRGSVTLGEGRMAHAIIENRWFVHESCASLLSSYRHYTGREEDLKHALDGVRYGVADLLLEGATSGARSNVVNVSV